MTPDLETLAARLSEAQRRAVLHFGNEWLPGPELPDEIIDEIDGLVSLKIVGRQFADMCPPKTKASAEAITVKVSACWYFGLTETGLQLRNHIESRTRGEEE